MFPNNDTNKQVFNGNRNVKAFDITSECRIQHCFMSIINSSELPLK